MMSDPDSARPITLPALGKQIELGEFYDARTNTFYDGLSAWTAEEVERTQIVRECPHTNFSFSTNNTERDESAGLDVEGSVSVKLKLFNASGSAQYLNSTKTHAYEARVVASCKVKTRDRTMPSEQLMNRKYDEILEKPELTHFVSKVVEGGEAHLSFSQKCSSAEEETRVKGQLSGSIKRLIASIEGSLAVEEKKEMIETHQSCEVTLTCNYNPPRPVVTFADAVDEASKLPQRLCGATQTTTVHLLPISVLDSKVVRICRSLDKTDMRKISKLLDDLQQASLELTNTKSSVVNKGWFPKVYDQVCGVEEQLLEADAIFRNKCTEVLPKLRELNDSSQSSQLKVSLRKAIKETEKAVKLVSRFVTAKENEVLMVRRILDEAGDQFVNDLASKQPKAAHCLVLSLAEADTIKHPLKAKLRLCKKRIIKIVNSNAEECSSSSSESDEDEDELEEWFESEMIMDNIFNNIGRMKELMMRNREGKVHENMEYRIGRIAKVDKEAVRCGDIVAVDNKGSKRRAVFLRQPTKVIAKESKNERSETQVVIEWTSDFELSLGDKCRVIYWKICDLEKRVKMSEEASVDVPVEPSSSCSVALPDSLLDCDSCYGLSVQIFSQLTGLSPRSAEVSLRPSPRMSVISRLVQFSSSHNATKLQKGGWELDKENGFLVVGRRNVRARSDQEPDKDCVVTIDVMPEYEPEIPFPRDDKEATVVLMTGLSGHGKSTHMNGMFNWIFRISQNDPIRLLLVDDRKHGDSSSKPITKRITVYRIRSHSGSRLKAPLYLIDTPAFGEGIESDENVTQAYATLFSRINKITCVVLAMRASESQCDPKTKAALTNILHQFGINVQNNIIALLTFANDDKRKPPALLAVLDEVRVPRRQYIEINNAFFACHSQEAIGSFLEASKASDTDGFGKFYWNLYEMGNEATFEAIGQLHPVNASQSASVVNKRCRLEEKLLSLRSNLTALLNEFSSYYRSFFRTSSYTQHSFDNFIKKHEELIATTRDCFVAPLRQIALRHDPESIYDYVCSFKWARSKVEALRDAINLSVYIDDSAEPEGASVIRCATGIKVILSVMRETKEKLSVDKETSGLYYRVSRMLTNKYGISTCITRQIETISDKDLDQIFAILSILIKNGIFTEAQGCITDLD